MLTSYLHTDYDYINKIIDEVNKTKDAEIGIRDILHTDNIENIISVSVFHNITIGLSRMYEKLYSDSDITQYKFTISNIDFSLGGAGYINVIINNKTIFIVNGNVFNCI